MSYIICFLCLCSVVYTGKAEEIQEIPNATHKQVPTSPVGFPTKIDGSKPIPVANKPKLEFPTKTDVTTPIIIGNNPKTSNLPPRLFPTKQDKDLAGPSIVSGSEISNTEINHSKDEVSKLNLTNKNISDKINMKILENATKTDTPQENDKAKVEQPTVEQEDMMHSKYKGGQDVDELKPEKKASEKDEKKVVASKKDPKSEVSVSPTMDKKGPKLMNETKTKSVESMLESTSKMMAVSSSVLANTQPKQHGIMDSAKTVVSVLLSAVALLCFGAIGLLVWKRISMRRFGRDVLINEDDFDEVADMHTFDRAQIQIT